MSKELIDALLAAIGGEKVKLFLSPEISRQLLLVTLVVESHEAALSAPKFYNGVPVVVDYNLQPHEFYLVRTDRIHFTVSPDLTITPFSRKT